MASSSSLIPIGNWGSRDENGSDTDRYHQYHISFHISGQIPIQIRMISTMMNLFPYQPHYKYTI